MIEIVFAAAEPLMALHPAFCLGAQGLVALLTAALAALAALAAHRWTELPGIRWGDDVLRRLAGRRVAQDAPASGIVGSTRYTDNGSSPVGL